MNYLGNNINIYHMSKKIKKINEFKDDLLFDINIDSNEYSEEYIKERDFKFSLQSKENLKDFPMKKSKIDIDFYRKTINEMIKSGCNSVSNEELDKYCMEIYGEPFFIKNDNSDNETSNN